MEIQYVVVYIRYGRRFGKWVRGGATAGWNELYL